MVKIIKASGEEVIFDKKHIEKSAINAGASKALAKETAKKVAQFVKHGKTTKQILDITLKCLKKEKGVSERYDLKRSIMELGPSGFAFEEYLAQILKSHGYKAKTKNLIKGKIVIQEVDVVAKKDNKTYMIEAKYHNNQGTRTNTKVAMYTYARFLDLQSNKKNHFNEAWLVTNTKTTTNALRYASGVNLKIIAWKYPKRGSLQELIESKSLYPVTIFKSVSRDTRQKLFKAKIMLANDLARCNVSSLKRKTGLDNLTIQKIIAEAKSICRLE